ncbi:MAG: hypothetical protein NUV78_01570 [Candidatus Zambryskibacteria bacterium]|nr:hypothetical protein [Candidatus Zambryskibacteria bacterium]
MGKLEENNKKRINHSDLQKLILHTIAAAGILSVGLVAPNVIGAMTKLGILPKRRQGEYTRSSANKMVERGLLRYNGKFYELTPTGERLLRRWQFADFKLKKPKKWDRKWRVIIFDVPQKLKKIRDRLTSLMRQAGFVRLQDSVWVYPYDCEDVFAVLKTDLGIGKHVLYMIVDELENDKYLRAEFELEK